MFFFGKIFLVVAWIVSSRVSCEVCCDDHNHQCNLFTDSTLCPAPPNCLWDNSKSACRNITCADRTESSGPLRCEIYSWCRLAENGSCVDRKTCEDLSSTTCVGSRDYDTRAACFYTGSKCRINECADWTNDDDCLFWGRLEGEEDGCYWDKTDPSKPTCKTVTSCGNYNRSICYSRSFNGKDCYWASNQCKSVTTCSDGNGNQELCGSIDGCACFGDSCTTCKTVNSCSEVDIYNCESTRVGTSSSNRHGCTLEGSNTCRDAVCSDFEIDSDDCEQTSYNNARLDCTWNATDNTCNPSPACGTYNTKSTCGDGSCYWLSSCPGQQPDTDGDAASAIITLPAFLMMMMALLFGFSW